MRLFDLSLRFKLPLWGGGLIIATALALSTSYVFQAWDNLNRDLLQNAEDIGRTTAHALFPVMLHDDVWEAFEVVSLPFAANPGRTLTESLIVLDGLKRVYVSSRPLEHPLLSPLAALGPEFAALGRELPMAPDAARSHRTIAAIDQRRRRNGIPIIRVSGRRARWAARPLRQRGRC